MSKLEVCDLCQKEIMARYEDEAYRFTIKKRWWSYDGFNPYREKTKLDICFNCMRAIIDVSEARAKGDWSDDLSLTTSVGRTQRAPKASHPR